MMCAKCEKKAASYTTSVRLWGLGHSKATPHATMHLELPVCTDCKKTMGRVRDFFPPESKKKIREVFRQNGQAAPDFNSAVFHFDAVQ